MVSLVGVGPGDPGLVTLHAHRAIRLADTVLYDALVHPAVVGFARPDAEKLFVGKRKGQDSVSQDEINHMLLYRARQGRRVARLKGGDPFLFGRGAEEALFLASHGVAFEVVPGVTAALGALAYAGIPITHRELSSSVALVTASEQRDKSSRAVALARFTDTTQTLVVYMGLGALDEILASLVESGRAGDTPAAVISCGTHQEQTVVVGTLETLGAMVATAKLSAPALVVVGEVVRLREALRWWHKSPLVGRKIVVTRAREQAKGFVEALTLEGAVVIEQPVIEVSGPEDPAAVTRALWALSHGAYEAVTFTSANAVNATFDALRAMGRDARAFGRTVVGAVGSATDAALRAHGISPDVVPEDHRGGALAERLTHALGERVHGARVLVLRAAVAHEDLAVALTAVGCDVDPVVVYRTVGAREVSFGPLRDALSRGEIDAVTFTSGSTVERFCERLGPDAVSVLSSTVIASIGPSTTKTAKGLGLTVAVEAGVFTTDGVVSALKEHFAQRQRDDG